MKYPMIAVLSMVAAFTTPAWASTGSICEGNRIVADQTTSDGWSVTAFTARNEGDARLYIRLYWHGEMDDCDSAFTIRDAVEFYANNLNLPVDILNQQFVEKLKASKPNSPIGWVDISVMPQPINNY